MCLVLGSIIYLSDEMEKEHSEIGSQADMTYARSILLIYNEKQLRALTKSRTTTTPNSSTLY